MSSVRTSLWSIAAPLASAAWHIICPDQWVQDGIAEAFADILELSNVKQNSCPQDSIDRPNQSA